MLQYRILILNIYLNPRDRRALARTQMHAYEYMHAEAGSADADADAEEPLMAAAGSRQCLHCKTWLGLALCPVGDRARKVMP